MQPSPRDGRDGSAISHSSFQRRAKDERLGREGDILRKYRHSCG